MKFQITAVILSLCVIISGFTVVNAQTASTQPVSTSQTATPKTGFRSINNSVYYYTSENSVAKGWKKIGGRLFYFQKNGKMLVGLKKVGKNKFCFNSKGSLGSRGSLLIGWVKIGKYEYYMSPKGSVGSLGKMLKNTIAGNYKDGFGYVSKSGKRVNSKSLKLAVKLVTERAYTKHSRAKKLKACFKFIKKYYSYQRRYGLPTAKNLEKDYARYMFKNKKGNCYCYASAFASIAKVLGYDCKIRAGKITTPTGGPDAHGWAEVRIKGKWYMFDISMHRKIKNIGLYKIPKGHYPYKYKSDKTFKLIIKKDRAVWKKA